MIRSRSRLIGEQVVLLVPRPFSYSGETVRNPMGEIVTAGDFEGALDDVLIVPGDSSDLTGSLRSEGDRTVYTLHFPKSFPETVKGIPQELLKSLKGARVRVRGEVFRVIGDPKPYMDVNTPTRWNFPVRVEVVNG